MFEQLDLFTIANEQKQDRIFNYKEYVRINNVNDDEQCAYLDYLTFKSWLYTYFPSFIDKEVETDNWQIVRKNSKINVKIGIYTSDPPIKQFVSVGYQYKSESGWSCPCDTLGEVRDRIEKALNEQH